MAVAVTTVRLRLLIQSHSFDVRVDVERWRPQKTDQRLIAFTREAHGQRGRCRHRRDDRDPGRKRFLHDFKRGTSTDEKNVSIERQESIEQRPPDHLVDRIVPANIFPDDDQFAVEIEDRSRMNSSGPAKIILTFSQRIREHQQSCQFDSHIRLGRDCRKVLSNRSDTVFAANTAAGRDRALASRRRDFYLRTGGERNSNDVFAMQTYRSAR